MLLPLLLAASAQAVPVQLAHQGRLLSADGVPLTGPHTLELALYDDPVGGDVLWAEAQDAEFVDGTFALLLGADVLNPIDDEVLADRALWLALSVDGAPDLPVRLPLSSAPFARLAGWAERADTATNVVGGIVDVSEVRVDGRTVIDGAGVVDTLSGLGCSGGEIVVFDEDFGEWVCAPMPEGVDEETVEGWVVDGPLDLAPGTTVGGEPLGGPVSWDDLLDVPAELFVDADSFALVSCDDGEILRWDGLVGRFDCAVDLVLDEGTVRAIVAAAPIDLAPGSTVGGVPVVAPTWAGLPDRPADLVDGDDDTLAALECAAGELAAWDGAGWACTSDATLSAEDVRAIVVSAPLDLSVGTTIGGEPLSGGPVLWADVRDVPADLVDGDADTLAGLGCAVGERAAWTGAVWACAPDADTLDSLGCDAGEVARFDGAAWACAPDAVGVLPEEVAALVPLDLPAETTFGGVAPVLGAVAWSDLTGRPADLLDGDDDLLADVSCAPGEALVWDGVVWDCYAPVDSDSLAELGLLCEDGQIPVYEAFEGSWSCADDQVLASDEVLAIVDGADLDLGPGTTLDGAALLTVGGGIPAELLPFDGLEAVSNGVLSNRFITRVFATGIPIPDNFPSGVASELVVPPVGTAADVRVSVDLVNSNIAGLTLELVAPDGSEILLYDGDGEGGVLTATYPDPDRPVSGDLDAWDGGDPSGTWTLTVIDSDYLDNTFDGEVVEWAIEVDAYSDDSVRIGGALVVEDTLSVDADLSVAGDLSVDGTLSLANPVDLPVGSTLGGRPLVDADNAALLAPNLLLNGGVDLWQRGDAAMPDGWYPSGALDYSREVADGREYGSVTAAAADDFVFQKLEAPGDWAGLPLTFAIDVAGEVGARVEVDDGVRVTTEDVPPGEGWQRIVLQHVVDPAADRVAVKLVPGVAGALAFDRATLAAGTWTTLPHVPRDPYAELRRAERWYELGRGSLYSDDAVENPVETWWFDFRTPKAGMPDIAFEVDNASGRPEYYTMRVSVVTTRGWYYDQENEDAEAGGAYDYHLTLDWTAEVPVSW